MSFTSRISGKEAAKKNLGPLNYFIAKLSRCLLTQGDSKAKAKGFETLAMTIDWGRSLS